MGERPGQAILVATHACHGRRVAVGGPRGHLGRRELGRVVPRMIARESGAGEEGFDAARHAAVAGPPRPFFVARPGQGTVSPFPGDGIPAGQRPAVDDDAAADSGPEDDAEDDLRAGRRPVDRLGEGEAIGVVAHPDRPVERAREIPIEAAADQPGRVGILHQARGRRDGSGDADTDAGAPVQVPFQADHQAGDRRDGGLIIALRAGYPLARQDLPARAQGDGLDLAASQVYANTHDTPRPGAFPGLPPSKS